MLTARRQATSKFDTGPVRFWNKPLALDQGGEFEPDPAGSVIFLAATRLDGNDLVEVQEDVRRRLLRSFVRRGLLTGNDARAMAQWEQGRGFLVDAWCASKPLTAQGESVCCVTAPGLRSTWND